MHQQRILWTPTDDDTAHLTILRTALARQGSNAPTDAAVISFALRTAAVIAHGDGRNPSGTCVAEPEPAEIVESVSLAVDPSLILVANTDGACSGNPGPGGWAVVFSQGGIVIGEHRGGTVATTNNRMELTAILEALRQAPAALALEIVTDSQNCIGWLSGGWKRKDPEIAAICREIDPLLKARKVTFRWVRGHNGDAMNERVDKLAVAAIPK